MRNRPRFIAVIILVFEAFQRWITVYSAARCYYAACDFLTDWVALSKQRLTAASPRLVKNR